MWRLARLCLVIATLVAVPASAGTKVKSTTVKASSTGKTRAKAKTSVTRQTSASATVKTSAGRGIATAPPAPYITFREEPRMTIVPRSTVFVVNDARVRYDLFRYGVYWYAFNDGYWYRARSHRGLFQAVDVRVVPRAIHSVPSKFWKRPAPAAHPGQLRKRTEVAVLTWKPALQKRKRR